MKKNFYLASLLIFLASSCTIINIKALGQTKRSKGVAQESPATQVNQEISTLDQIVEQAKIIVNATGPTAHKIRAAAKSQINKLMKELDPSTKEVIQEYIKTILGTTIKTQKESQRACNDLIATINAMSAQADVITAIEEGNKAIKQAPAEMKEQVIARQVQNIQAVEAKAEEIGMMGRVTGSVKSILAAPGNYFFGEERTKAKTAFEATVGALITGGATYLAYKNIPEEQKSKLYETFQRYSPFGNKKQTPSVPSEEELKKEYREAMGDIYKTGKQGISNLLTTTKERLKKGEYPKGFKEEWNLPNNFGAPEPTEETKEGSDLLKAWWTKGLSTPEEELEAPRQKSEAEFSAERAALIEQQSMLQDLQAESNAKKTK